MIEIIGEFCATFLVIVGASILIFGFFSAIWTGFDSEIWEEKERRK